MPIKMVKKSDAEQKVVEAQPVVADTSVVEKHLGKVVSENAKSEIVGHATGTPPLCNVGVEASSTINMGDFNSIRVGVSLHIPCEFNDIDKTYELAQSWVNAKMEELQEQIHNAGG